MRTQEHTRRYRESAGTGVGEPGRRRGSITAMNLVYHVHVCMVVGADLQHNAVASFSMRMEQKKMPPCLRRRALLMRLATG